MPSLRSTPLLLQRKRKSSIVKISYGWNFRSTLAGPSGFTGDVAPDVWIGPSAVGVSGSTAGWLGFTPVTDSNDNIAYSAKAAGYVGLPNGDYVYFTAPAVAGTYKLRLAAGTDFTSSPCAFSIWDGYCGLTGNVDPPYWTASTSVGVNTWSLYAGNLYQVTTGGTTDASVPPTHVTGAQPNGTATFTFRKSAAFTIRVTSQANNFIDAVGASYTPTTWQTSNTLSAPFSLSNGFFTVQRSDISIGGVYFRHLGLVAQ